MLRHTYVLRMLVILALLGGIAVFAGGFPWGPG